MSNLREEENYLCSVIKFAQAVFPLGGNGKGAEPNYYIHDAQGNVLAVYSSSMVMYNISLHVTQQYIYGSSRLGAYNRNQQVFPTVLPPFPFTLSNAFTRGQKHYELSNHLGNVNSVISDRKLQTSTDGIYVPDVKSFTDYYPFGYQMENRSWQQIAYRYGFNGQENDNEIYGVGNFLNFEFRGYDSRLGRWWSIDPLAGKQSWISPYAFCFNDPINYIDPKGEFPWKGVTFFYEEVSIGAGIGYGLYLINQKGMALDKHGKTKFMRTGVAHFTNQNLKESSTNPNFVLGTDIGGAYGATQDWSSSSFLESVDKSNQLSSSGPSIKGKLGLGVGFNKNSASLSIGLQAGFTFQTMGMDIDESISLTDKEASKAGVMNNWMVPSYTRDFDQDERIIGFSGTVRTKDLKGKFTNTKIPVKCGVTYDDDGNARPDNRWVSVEYQKSIDKEKK